MSGLDTDQQKAAAARAALDRVESGMRLGLGTGSTAARFVDLLGARVADGLDIIGVPTSEATRVQAEGLGIPLTTLGETPHLDLTVDGADELDEQLRLIKGGGGALLREKIVATASESMIVIADSSKLVATLGQFPLPVEVDRFGYEATHMRIEQRARDLGLDGAITVRHAPQGGHFVTDGGNYIIDCAFGAIPEPERLAEGLNALAGVVEHGLFIGLATTAIVAGPQGVRVLGETQGQGPEGRIV